QVVDRAGVTGLDARDDIAEALRVEALILDVIEALLLGVQERDLPAEGLPRAAEDPEFVEHAVAVIRPQRAVGGVIREHAGPRCPGSIEDLTLDSEVQKAQLNLLQQLPALGRQRDPRAVALWVVTHGSIGGEER